MSLSPAVPVADFRKKIALSKFLTNRLTFQLTKLDSPIRSSYLNTFYCCDSITMTDDDRTVMSYCKNRFCLTCNRIKTAELINGYYSEIANLADPWFLTLTVPNVDADLLPAMIAEMAIRFRQCCDRLRKKGFKLTGMRKLECTYNKHSKTYHPHYHIIVSGGKFSSSLLQAWLDSTAVFGSNPAGQDLRKADENSVKELFKYFTKLVDGRSFMNIYALDTIFRALHRKRIFFAYGLTKVKDRSPAADPLHGTDFFFYYPDVRDWVNIAGDYWADVTDEDLKSSICSSLQEELDL